jgi:hypothetical protein
MGRGNGKVFKLTTAFKSTITVLVFGVALLLLPTGAYSQADDDDRLATAEARLGELEEAIADLEGRLAVLESESTTPVPSEQDVPTPSPATVAPGTSSRDQPVPMGTAARAGDWSISVLAVTPDAWAAIQAENQFNDPPEPGHQFVMVTISLTYEGTESADPGFDPSFKAVGESNVAYDTFSPGCGVVPRDLSSAGEVFTGGTIEANVCFSVDSEDVDSLVMYVESLFSIDDSRTWFSLNDDVEHGDG